MTESWDSFLLKGIAKFSRHQPMFSSLILLPCIYNHGSLPPHSYPSWFKQRKYRTLSPETSKTLSFVLRLLPFPIDEGEVGQCLPNEPCWHRWTHHEILNHHRPWEDQNGDAADEGVVVTVFVIWKQESVPCGWKSHCSQILLPLKLLSPPQKTLFSFFFFFFFFCYI